VDIGHRVDLGRARARASIDSGNGDQFGDQAALPGPWSAPDTTKSLRRARGLGEELAHRERRKKFAPPPSFGRSAGGQEKPGARDRAGRRRPWVTSVGRGPRPKRGRLQIDIGAGGGCRRSWSAGGTARRPRVFQGRTRVWGPAASVTLGGWRVRDEVPVHHVAEGFVIRHANPGKHRQGPCGEPSSGALALSRRKG